LTTWRNASTIAPVTILADNDDGSTGMRYKVRVDVGGTFTELVAMEEIGNVTIANASTTPGDQYFRAPGGGELHSFKRVRDMVEREEGQIFLGHYL
jgi:hypothetical protein